MPRLPGIPPRGEAKPHNEQCRTRIEEAIKNDEHDRSRWEKHDNRINERLMRKMEEQQEVEERAKMKQRISKRIRARAKEKTWRMSRPTRARRG